MTKISLTNTIKDAFPKRVVIDLSNAMCTLDDDQELALKDLFHLKNFSHPLLEEPRRRKSNNVYHYEYHDVDGLLYSAIYVYSTLIHTKNPLECHFQINPSAKFQPLPHADKIYISTDPRKGADESIPIKKFTNIISRIRGHRFEFSEDVIIYDTFSARELPTIVDADRLYIENKTLIAILKDPPSISALEVRYIDPIMRFGVFARDVIKQNTVIAIYSGIKKVKEPDYLNYTFNSHRDLLKQLINSYYYGNISGFINHAYSKDERQEDFKEGQYLEANVSAENKYANGILLIVYTAERDILKDEQLLVSYGKNYYGDNTSVSCKEYGAYFPKYKQSKKQLANRKLEHLRIMANHGVNSARKFLIKRMVCITGLFLVFFAALHLKTSILF